MRRGPFFFFFFVDGADSRSSTSRIDMPRAPFDHQLHPYFQILVEMEEDALDWPKFFGNDNPVELDIGCGRGVFLTNSAVENRDRNYLGMEIAFKEARYTARKLKRRELPNARVVAGDSRDALSKMIAPGSVDAAHVYFPDPWWKKKHKRRRLFTDTFVELLARVVRPGGHVHSWTDVEDYFEVIKALMDHANAFDICSPPDQREPTHDMDYLTSFERKKRQEGETIYRGLWQRRQTDAPNE